MEMLLSAELLLQPRERLMEQYILFCAYLLSPATKHSFYTELLFPPNIFWKKNSWSFQLSFRTSLWEGFIINGLYITLIQDTFTETLTLNVIKILPEQTDCFSFLSQSLHIFSITRISNRLFNNFQRFTAVTLPQLLYLRNPRAALHTWVFHLAPAFVPESAQWSL